MNLSIGARFGTFDITGSLGAGGMGEVYRARDTRLKRDVALKVLPVTFAADPDRVARFQREAELLAALSHPNIATVYGLEESTGPEGHVTRALVMELVEGETLADRLGAGAIPADEVIDIARQLAEALDYAHEHGVLHRDLKPANLKLTSEGQVKVLDFGLAKLSQSQASDSRLQALGAPGGESPTITSPAQMTGAGVILGTAAYMSPEQARGRAVDKRADIWAYGCVLYELLTGRRAFEGETLSDTLAAVLKSDPDWSAMPASAPAGLRELIQRCLTRDAKARLRDIGEAKRYLDAPGAPAASAQAAPTPASARGRLLPWSIAAALAAGLAAAVLQWAPWQPAPPAPIQRLSVDLGVEATLRTDVGSAAALSPDGQVLAFAAYPLGSRESHLYVRRLDQLQATQLAGSEDAYAPFFSPDGAWVAFFAGGKLKKVEVTSGSPMTLADAPNPRGGHWTDDGRIVLLPEIGGGQGLKQVSAAGGALTPFIEPDPNASQRWPQVLPGGRAVLYTRIQPGTAGTLYVQPLPDGERRLLRSGEYGRYLPSGHLLFVENGALLSMPFDLATLSVSGEATRVLDGMSVNATNGAQIAAGAGTLVYRVGTVENAGVPLEWLDATGAVTPLVTEAMDWVSPRFSPSGRQLAYLLPGGGGQWILDLARGVRSRITVGNPTTGVAGGANLSTAWSPDGQRIVFSQGPDGAVPNLHWRRADGSGDVQRLAKSPYAQTQPSWHPNGRHLAFQQSTPPVGDIMLMTVDGSDAAGWKFGDPSKLTTGPLSELDPAFSPDGRWLAYTSNESGRYEVYVRPFPDSTGQVVVSAQGGRYPQWSPREQRLFFVGRSVAPSPIYVVDYTVENGAFVPTAPRQWTNRMIMPRRIGLNYALHPDGKRIAAHVAPEAPAVATASDKLVIVTNFLDELRRVTPQSK